MSYPLRLPENLDAKARQRSADIGISFNAFICVCVDAYVNGASRPASARPAVGKPDREAPRQAQERPDWRRFHQDPNVWPYVDPDFKPSSEDLVDTDPDALEAEYWATRERPAEAGDRAAPAPGVAPSGSGGVVAPAGRVNLTKRDRKRLSDRNQRR